ncbi:MAG: esterase-like activity of phytase family protein [Nitratireductor sp.]
MRAAFLYLPTCIAFFTTVIFIGIGSLPSRADTLAINAAQVLNFRLGDNKTGFGRLEFTGGLVLSSDDKDFGGLSGIRFIDGQDRFMAVSDAGHIFTASIRRDILGAPVDVFDARKDAIPGIGGFLSGLKQDSDCEAIEMAGDRLWLSFERKHRIDAYALSNGVISGEPKPFNDQIRKLRLSSNRGLEALALLDGSVPGNERLLAISEESLDGDGNMKAFTVTADAITPLSLLRKDGFDATDAVSLPGGDILVLERRYSLKTGPAMRLRRIAASSITGGVVLDGETLLEADITFRIDNMEGLAVRQDNDGNTRITIVSDDNFSVLQSTLLLEFRLAE